MEPLRKQWVTIAFEVSGTQPPVFVCGDFTTLPWAPHEMDFKETTILGGKTEYMFSKDFEVAGGRWQYKFRLGTGEWWVCDENTEIVTDETGNRNNLLVVVPPVHQDFAPEDKHAHLQPLTQSKSFSPSTAGKASANEAVSTQYAQGASKGYLQQDSGTLKKSSAWNDQDTSISERQDSKLSDQDAVQDKKPNANQHQEDEDDGKNGRKPTEGFKLFLTMPHTPAVSREIKAETILEEDEDYSANYFSPSGIERNNSNAPLFAHECLHTDDADDSFSITSSEKDLSSRQRSTESVCSQDSIHEPITPELLKDPHLERFPCGAEQVLERMATLHEELPPDDCTSTDLDYNAPHEVTEFGMKSAPTFSHELPPIGSPTAYRLRHSPLHPHDIPEESDIPTLSHDNLAPLYAHILGSSSPNVERNGSMRRSLAEARHMLQYDEHEPLIRSNAITAD